MSDDKIYPMPNLYVVKGEVNEEIAARVRGRGEDLAGIIQAMAERKVLRVVRHDREENPS